MFANKVKNNEWNITKTYNFNWVARISDLSAMCIRFVNNVNNLLQFFHKSNCIISAYILDVYFGYKTRRICSVITTLKQKLSRLPQFLPGHLCINQNFVF